MRVRHATGMMLAFIVLECSTLAQQQGPGNLRITTSTLPLAVVGERYHVRLQADGGRPRYRWRVMRPPITPGLSLNARTGEISGRPRQPSESKVTVQVTDSSRPVQAATQTFELRIAPPLTVRWTRSPAIQNGGIFGAVRVANNSAQDSDLTLIVVGTNEINKAFTLAYQHFLLHARTESAEIPFGFALPPGTYAVRADAVAEVPSTGTVRRANMVTSAPLSVP